MLPMAMAGFLAQYAASEPTPRGYHTGYVGAIPLENLGSPVADFDPLGALA